MKITDYQDRDLLDRIREQENIPRMWTESAKKYGSLIAVKEEGKALTYRELEEAVCRFRGYLYQKGYRQGGGIRIIAQRSIGFVKAFLAAETLGLCVNVLPEELPKDAAQGDPKASVQGDPEDVLTPEIYEEEQTGPDIPAVYPEREAAAAVMFTGGTTGIPKKAVLSHRCIMVAIRNGCYGYQNVFNQKYLHVLPMHHVFGLIRSMLTCLATGGTLILCRDPRKMFETAIAEEPGIAVLVPLLVDRGVTMSKKTGKNLFGPGMKTIITGAAPVAAHLSADCRALGITLCPGYGLTETACLVSGNPDMEGHPGSVGLLYPDQEARFVEGELQIRGKNIMTGYVGGKEAGFTPDGWFATGDIGYLDEEGFLYLLGRKKEMLLTANGENVFPAPVEARFNALPEVADCELFEGDDGRLWMEVLPRDPEADPARLKELEMKIEAVNESLPKHERASMITFRKADFPRTKSMKIIRRGNGHGQI